LKNSLALNTSHKEKNTVLEANLKETTRKYTALKAKGADAAQERESLERRTEEKIAALEAYRQKAERDAKQFEYDLEAEQKKVGKRDEELLQSRQ